MLAFVPWILMRAHVPPGPAVEAAFLHVSDVVGHEVVAECIALIYGAPEFAGLRIYANTSAGVADSVGIDFQFAMVRIAGQNVGAVFLVGVSVRIVDVGSRADGNKHSRTIGRKFEGARPVTATVRQVGDVLRRSARFEIAIVIRKADYFIGVADINPLRVIARRIKGNSIRMIQALCEYLHLFGLAVLGQAAEDANASGIALRQKNVAGGRGTH